MKSKWSRTFHSKFQKAIDQKIERKLAVASSIYILAAVIATVFIMKFGSSNITQTVMKADTQTSMYALTNQIDGMKIKSANYVKIFAENEGLYGAVESKSQSSLLNIISVVKKSVQADVDFVTVTDTDGKVLATTSSDKTGDNISHESNISDAKKGIIRAYLEKGTVNKFSVRAGAPIRSNAGDIAGIISVGYDLDRAQLLDDLKKTTGCEYAVFLGETPLNTTFIKGGKRQMQAAVNTAAVQSVLNTGVTNMGQMNLMGSFYYTRYQPVLGTNGKPEGVLFVGKPVSSILAIQQEFLLIAIFAALLIACISIVLFIRFTRKEITNPISTMSLLAARLADGNLRGQEITYSSRNEIGQLAQSLKSMSDKLKSYVGNISQNLTAMAAGDMTAEIELDYIGDFKPIKDALQKIYCSLNATLFQIEQSASQVNSGAEQVSAGSQLLAQGATEQAGSILELSGTVADVSHMVGETSQKICDMTQTLSGSADEISVSNREAADMLGAMGKIRDSSNKIKQIIKSIDSIAFQTNILALNAAVEAARAGSAGKGFSVVADEVRALAVKSSEASKETATLIEDSLDKVRDGFQLADKSAKSSQHIYTTLQQVAKDMEAVNRSSNEQAEQIIVIKKGIDQISSVVQTNSATAEESAAASKELFDQAEFLQKQVGKFTLKKVFY